MVTDIFERMERLGRWLDTVENPYLLSPSEKYIYDERLKIYRDFNNCMDYCEAKGRAEGRAEVEAKRRGEGEAIGRAEGRAEERLSVAKEMLAKKMDLDLVMEITKLSKDQLKSLL